MSKTPRFKVGDRVRWVRAVSSPERKNFVGTIASVIADDIHVDEFTMYEVKFQFGVATLYGTQIEVE
jgi:hypothetical protein